MLLVRIATGVGLLLALARVGTPWFVLGLALLALGGVGQTCGIALRAAQDVGESRWPDIAARVFD